MSVWVQFSTDGSPLALWLYSSEQYSVHRFSICRSSVRHFPQRSWTVVTFPCFTVVQSFYQFVCPLTVVLLQIFFNLTTLFPYPVLFSLFMLLLMLLFTSLYFAAPSGSNLFFLKSLLLSDRSGTLYISMYLSMYLCISLYKPDSSLWCGSDVVHNHNFVAIPWSVSCCCCTEQFFHVLDFCHHRCTATLLLHH